MMLMTTMERLVAMGQVSFAPFYVVFVVSFLELENVVRLKLRLKLMVVMTIRPSL
jgi:hypothetical protein